MSAAGKVIAWHKECLAQRNLPGAQRAGVSAGAAFCLVQMSLADPRAHSAAQPPHALQGALGLCPACCPHLLCAGREDPPGLCTCSASSCPALEALISPSLAQGSGSAHLPAAPCWWPGEWWEAGWHMAEGVGQNVPSSAGGREGAWQGTAVLHGQGKHHPAKRGRSSQAACQGSA